MTPFRDLWSQTMVVPRGSYHLRSHHHIAIVGQHRTVPLNSHLRNLPCCHAKAVLFSSLHHRPIHRASLHPSFAVRSLSLSYCLHAAVCFLFLIFSNVSICNICSCSYG